MPRSPPTWRRRWRASRRLEDRLGVRSGQAACEEFVNLARAAAGHQLLHLLTRTGRCRSVAEFETERQLLIDLGIPAALLPDVRGLRRFDLPARPG